MQFLGCCFTNSKRIKSNIALVEVQDLNFVLCLKIFVHYDSQLQASHLILGCTPLYTSYQTSRLALLASNPLLTYKDVQIPGFLPNILANEARKKGSHQARDSSKELVMDGSGDIVFHGRLQHIPMNDLKEEEEDEDEEEEDMVRWCNIKIRHYFLEGNLWRATTRGRGHRVA